MNALESNWQKFVVLGEEDVDVRKSVMDSWNRSKKSGVSFEKNRILPYLEKNEWEEKRRKNHTLIEAARPVMQEIFEQVKGKGYQVNLVDADGYFMEMLADRKAEFESSQIGISAGVRWREEHVGTTGLTIALSTRSPIVTSGAEHYWTKLWIWDCAAAPILIFDQFVGVLNICRLSGSGSLHEFQTLATTAAHSISLRMQMESMKMRERTLSDLLTLSHPAQDSTGILAFNQDGKLVYHNPSAFDILSTLQREKIEQLPKDGESSHIVCDKSGKEYFIESKVCKSGEEVSSTVLWIHSGQPSKFRVISNTSTLFSSFRTKEESFRKTLHKASKAAKSDLHILLQGESGTGKDYMARAIHQESERKNQPFIAINCASLPRELISSELFGYGPGAFTGANRNGNPGKIEAANGGTLFLDEIGDMPLDLQSVLLRTLEEKQVTRIGSSTPIPINVRFIAATYKDLREAVRKGEFREDLYYRLSVVKLNLPPLRERKTDLEELIQSIAEPICRKAVRRPFSLTSQALQLLQKHEWKGNLRELRNMIERIAYFHEEDLVDAIDLGEYVELSSHLDPSDNEKEHLVLTLQRTSGNRAMAARELGISRTALYRKLEKYGL